MGSYDAIVIDYFQMTECLWMDATSIVIFKRIAHVMKENEEANIVTPFSRFLLKSISEKINFSDYNIHVLTSTNILPESHPFLSVDEMNDTINMLEMFHFPTNKVTLMFDVLTKAKVKSVWDADPVVGGNVDYMGDVTEEDEIFLWC